MVSLEPPLEGPLIHTTRCIEEWSEYGHQPRIEPFLSRCKAKAGEYPYRTSDGVGLNHEGFDEIPFLYSYDCCTETELESPWEEGEWMNIGCFHLVFNMPTQTFPKTLYVRRTATFYATHGVWSDVGKDIANSRALIEVLSDPEFIKGGKYE